MAVTPVSGGNDDNDGDGAPTPHDRGTHLCYSRRRPPLLDVPPVAVAPTTHQTCCPPLLPTTTIFRIVEPTLEPIPQQAYHQSNTPSLNTLASNTDAPTVATPTPTSVSTSTPSPTLLSPYAAITYAAIPNVYANCSANRSLRQPRQSTNGYAATATNANAHAKKRRRRQRPCQRIRLCHQPDTPVPTNSYTGANEIHLYRQPIHLCRRVRLCRHIAPHRPQLIPEGGTIPPLPNPNEGGTIPPDTALWGVRLLRYRRYIGQIPTRPKEGWPIRSPLFLYYRTI